jgi:hypothetical protein
MGTAESRFAASAPALAPAKALMTLAIKGESESAEIEL